MRKALCLGPALLFVLAIAAGCSPKQAPVPSFPTAAPTIAAIPAQSPKAVPAKPPLQDEWNQVIAAAQREGTAVLAISAGAGPGRAVEEGLKSAYGVRVETIAGSAGSLAAKILAERRAGLYLWDVFIGGSGSQLTVLKAGGGMGPTESVLVLPELRDQELIKRTWYQEKLPWVDQDHKLLAPFLFPSVQIGINTNLVKPGEIKTWDDLLDPKWKEKIILMDPTIPGNSQNDVMPMLYSVKGENWVRKLAGQVGAILQDDRLANDWLSRGKYPIYVPPRQGIFLEFVRAGAPIRDVVPEDGSVLGASASAISLVDTPAHPNAAKLLINWYLSKEGQVTMSKAHGGQGARLDVPTDFLRPEQMRDPNVKYWLKEREDVLLKISDYSKASKEIFKTVVK